jgi:hypothetical protein
MTTAVAMQRCVPYYLYRHLGPFMATQKLAHLNANLKAPKQGGFVVACVWGMAG